MCVENKKLVDIYQEAQNQLEELRSTKNGLMDKVRSDYQKKAGMVHDGYMVDEMGELLRNAAKAMLMQTRAGNVTESDIRGYVFTPNGLEVNYGSYELDEEFTIIYTWDELQLELDQA